MDGKIRALVIIDLQNEFLSPSGRFPIREASKSLLGSLAVLLPRFRESGRVYWVRSEYANDKSVIESSPTTSETFLDSDALFLEGTHVGRKACCQARSFEAEFYPQASKMIDNADHVIVKTWYSAFKETSLLEDLQQEGIQDVYFCGLLTNTCVSATVTSAIQNGLKAHVVTDCLGWRNEESHKKALVKLADMGAVLLGSNAGALLSKPAARTGPGKPPVRKKGLNQVLTAGDVIAEGDTSLVLDLLPPDLAQIAFERVKEETAWKTMHHRGGEVPRRVAVEGEIGDDGSIPIYRHPADESPPLLPFSPTVSLIRRRVEEVLNHPVNHVLIQYYRNGEDYISEHSDKTIDVVRGSKIVNVSLGAQRLMILRTKKGNASESEESRTAQRIVLPHNSMFVLGLETNGKWLHGIRRDGRAQNLKTPAELAFEGERISLTFRNIGTFLTHGESHIYGQGAVGKTKEEARPVLNGNREESLKLITAFGHENQQTDFDWDAAYGTGSDVLHFRLRPLPQLYYVNGSIPSWRVQLALYEKGIEVEQIRLKVMSQPKETRLPAFLALNPRGKTPVLVDNDTDSTTINESLAILTYIETFYTDGTPLLPPLKQRPYRARVLARTQETENLHNVYDVLEDAFFGKLPGRAVTQDERPALVKAVYDELKIWEGYALASPRFIAGGEEFTLADCAFFPILAYMLHRGLPLDNGDWPGLKRYYDTVWGRETGSAKKAQPEGWEGPGRANVFKDSKGGAQPVRRNEAG